MKKHFLLFLLCLATNASLTAQETLRENNGEPTLVERLSNGEIKINSAEMNFQLFTSANAEFVGNELDGMNFKLNRVRLEIKGDVGKWLGYHYRQSFNKYSDPYSLDNLSSSLELAYVNLKARHNLNFTIGKQFVNFGGYEYYVNSIRVREFSEFNNLLTAYQAGISGNWQVNPDHELCFQIVNNRNGNDEDIYPTGLPEGTAKAKIPFMYTVNWNSYYLDKTLQLRYATAVGQQTHEMQGAAPLPAVGHGVHIGRVLKKVPCLNIPADVMYTRQGIDQHGVVSRLPGTPHTAMNTEYLSIIGDVDYRVHPQWNVYVKGAYETARVYKSNGDFRKGMYRRSWNAQSSVEFFPFKQLDLFVFVLYTYRGVILEKAATRMGAIEPDTHRISLGLVYSIPVF